jgi:oxygen-independent coproporphyrinogen-3 oxidase
MGLRLTSGVNLEAYRKRFGMDLAQELLHRAERFIDHGLLETDNGWLRLTKPGYLLSNQVLCCFAE